MTYVEVACKTCRKLFKAKAADRKRGWGLFCSKSCKAVKQERRTGQHRAYLDRIFNPPTDVANGGPFMCGTETGQFSP